MLLVLPVPVLPCLRSSSGREARAAPPDARINLLAGNPPLRFAAEWANSFRASGAGPCLSGRVNGPRLRRIRRERGQVYTNHEYALSSPNVDGNGFQLSASWWCPHRPNRVPIRTWVSIPSLLAEIRSSSRHTLPFSANTTTVEPPKRK